MFFWEYKMPYAINLFAAMIDSNGLWEKEEKHI